MCRYSEGMPNQAYPFSPLSRRHHFWQGELFTYV